MIFLQFCIYFVKFCCAFSPSDNPLFKKQYYIKNDGSIFNGISKEDLNVVPAWEAGSTGEGVHIVVINDGCQANHSDLKENFDFDLSYNYITNSNDPSYDPRQFILDTGTKLATVAAGSDNQICGIGIAFKSKVSCVAVIAGNKSVINYKEGIKRDKDTPRSVRLFPSYSQYQSGLVYLSEFDENEENSFNQQAIYVTSVHNGAIQVNEDLSYLYYPSNPYILTFAEISQRGGRTLTSLRGNVILGSVVTGGGDYDSQVASLSAYISTGDGFDNICSETILPSYMGGSMATGVISLILSSTNEPLKTNDITAIIALTSVKNDPYSKTWKTNKKGIRYSPIYGFGRLDAEAAVKMAKSYRHKEKAPTETAKSNSKSLPLSIPSFLSETVNVQLHLTNSKINYIDFIELIMTFSSKASDYALLRIFVVSPLGTERLVKDVAPVREPQSHKYRIAARDFFGESAGGVWTVKFLRENIGPAEYKLEEISIKVTGYEDSDFPPQSSKEGSNPFQTYQKVDATLIVQPTQQKENDKEKVIGKDKEKVIDNEKVIGKDNEKVIDNENVTRAVSDPIKIQCNKLFTYLVKTEDEGGRKKYGSVPFDLVLTQPNDEGQFERFGTGLANAATPAAVYCMYKSGTYKLRAVNPAYQVSTNDVIVELLNPGEDDYSDTGFGAQQQYRQIKLMHKQLSYTAIPISVVRNIRESFSSYKIGYFALATLWNTETGKVYDTQITQSIGGQYIYRDDLPCKKCVLTVVPLESDDLLSSSKCNTFVNTLSIVDEVSNTTEKFEIEWNDACPPPSGVLTVKPTHKPTYYVLSTKMIVIIAVTSCAILVLLIVVVYCLVKRRKNSYGISYADQVISASLIE